MRAPGDSQEDHYRALLEGAIEECADLAHKVQFLVDYMTDLGIAEDGVFCFPDGDIWHATEPLVQAEKLV